VEATFLSDGNVVASTLAATKQAGLSNPAEEKMAAGLCKLFLVKIGKGDPRDDVVRAAAVKQALGDRARAYTSTSIRVGIRPRQFGRLNGCRTLVSPLSNSHCLARISKGCGG
jgi:hypothetical protein